MKAKDKAKELVDKMWCIKSEMFGMPLEPLTVNEAKQCALIAVDEIVKALNVELDPVISIRAGRKGNTRLIGGVQYWQEVKNEIEKL